jgi:hypothetical protein
VRASYEEKIAAYINETVSALSRKVQGKNVVFCKQGSSKR